MAKVTYLFGAGASAEVLPIVADMPSRIQGFRDHFLANRKASEDKIDSSADLTVLQIEEEILSFLGELLLLLPQHASIDTLAKKYSILGDIQSYKKLKIILSAFFIYEQLIHPVDRRYDTFFASILNSSSTDFIGDINILSWNYDFQFEKAYSIYSQTNSLRSNQAILNVNFPLNDRFRSKNGFNLFKLNGTVGLYSSSNREYYPIYDDVVKVDTRGFFDDFIKSYTHYLHLSQNLNSTLMFAWDREETEYFNKVVEYIKETNILVVVGYSIPFFNRKIDKKNINSMIKSLSKIYIQDIYPNDVESSLRGILEPGHRCEIIPIKNVKSFFIPPEL